MRRIAVGLGMSLLAASLLAGCGPDAVSYSDGFAVGQSVAAARDTASLHGAATLAACRRQWLTSGPATDRRSVWIRGCVAGVRHLEANIGM